MARTPKRSFVICIDNAAYPASLEKRKIYVQLADEAAAAQGLVTVIDESGEDYLYPREFFRTIELPQSLRRALLAAA
jgi:hypothetical protein